MSHRQASEAINRGDISSLKKLIQRDPALLTAEVEDGFNLLGLACGENQIEIAQLLAGMGVNVNIRDDYGNSPIHYAVTLSSIEVLSFLISCGADLEARGVNRNSPLHTASRIGNEETCKYLLKSGAEVNSRCDDGRTPLHLAAMDGNDSVVRLLIAHGATVDALSDSQRTPLQYAAAFDNMGAAKVLIDNGANLSHVNSEGDTAYDIAFCQGSSEEMLALLKKGDEQRLSTMVEMVTRQIQSGNLSTISGAEYEIVRDDKSFILIHKGAYVTTPGGRKLASIHAPLMTEVLRDVCLFGPDPTATTSMVSLQSSYLDFAVPQELEILSEFVFSKWRTDLYFRPVQNHSVMRLQEELYGPLARQLPFSHLRGFNKRQLMSVIVGGENMGSPIAIVHFMAGILTLDRASRGLCERYVRHCTSLMREDLGGVSLGEEPYAPLYQPRSYDEQYCRKCLTEKGFGERGIAISQCRVSEVLDKIKRFAEFAEEPTSPRQ